MKEYIERDALDLEYYDLLYHGTMAVKAALPVFKELLDKQPAADVVERVRGEWIGKPIAGYTTVKCSACGSAFSANTGRWKFCPNCGADMRGEA